MVSTIQLRLQRLKLICVSQVAENSIQVRQGVLCDMDDYKFPLVLPRQSVTELLSSINRTTPPARVCCKIRSECKASQTDGTRYQFAALHCPIPDPGGVTLVHVLKLYEHDPNCRPFCRALALRCSINKGFIHVIKQCVTPPMKHVQRPAGPPGVRHLMHSSPQIASSRTLQPLTPHTTVSSSRTTDFCIG